MYQDFSHSKILHFDHNDLLCCVWISEKKTANFALQNIKRLVFIIEMQSVYYAVRKESLHKTDYVASLKV